MSAGVGNVSGRTMMSSSQQEAVSFSSQLKAAGKEDHDQVEGAPIIKAIFDGSISDEEYMDYLACLFEVYDQLEIELALLESNPLTAPLNIPAIFRAESIKADLKAFGNEQRKPNQKAEEYRAHLTSLGQYQPHRLIAHAYLRYLGDLFGGMMIGRRLKDKFEGKLNFYDFNALCDLYQLKTPTSFASAFRKILDNLPLSPGQQKDILDEVQAGYKMHGEMFKQLKA